jgi:hypothetical protein
MDVHGAFWLGCSDKALSCAGLTGEDAVNALAAPITSDALRCGALLRGGAVLMVKYVS